MQADSLAHGIHLGHFGVVLLESGPQGHGHFQTERGAAGDTQLLQAENAVNETGGEGQCQQGVDGEAALQQVAQTVQHQIAAQQSGNQHRQHLTENHQLHAIFRHQLQGEQGGHTAADQHHQKIQQDCRLKPSHTHFGQLIIPAFRAGNQLFFQLLQPGAGGEHDGSGDEFLLHLKGRLRRGRLRCFRFLRQIDNDGRLVCRKRFGGNFLHRVKFLRIGQGWFFRFRGGFCGFLQSKRCGFFRACFRDFFRDIRRFIIEPQFGHLPGRFSRLFGFRVLAEFFQNVL